MVPNVKVACRRVGMPVHEAFRLYIADERLKVYYYKPSLFQLLKLAQYVYTALMNVTAHTRCVSCL